MGSIQPTGLPVDLRQQREDFRIACVLALDALKLAISRRD